MIDLLSQLTFIYEDYQALVNKKLIQSGDSVFNLKDKQYLSKIDIINFFKKITEKDQSKLKPSEKVVSFIDLLQRMIRIKFEDIPDFNQNKFITTMQNYAKDVSEKESIKNYITEGYEEEDTSTKPAEVGTSTKPATLKVSFRKLKAPPKLPAASPKSGDQRTLTEQIPLLSLEAQNKNPDKTQVPIFKKDIQNLLDKFPESGLTLKKLGIEDTKIENKRLKELSDYYLTLKSHLDPRVKAGRPKFSEGGSRKRITPRKSKSKSKSVSKRQSRKSRKVRS